MLVDFLFSATGQRSDVFMNLRLGEWDSRVWEEVGDKSCYLLADLGYPTHQYTKKKGSQGLTPEAKVVAPPLFGGGPASYTKP